MGKKENKKIEISSGKGRIIKILAFIFGLTAILICAIPILNLVGIICGVIGLILSIIAMKRAEKKGLATAALILSIIAIFIGTTILLVAFGIVWLFASLGGNSIKNYTNYSIGETISSGNMSYTVISADKTVQIKNNQGQIIPLETTGYFLSIKINLENRNLQPITMFGSSYDVIDDAGRMFNPLYSAEEYYSNSISSNGVEVQPGVLFKGIKIFEVPKDSAGLRLLIALNSTNGADVKLEF